MCPPEWTDGDLLCLLMVCSCNIHYLTLLHYHYHRLNCQRWCVRHCTFWQPRLCNTTREVRTTMYFSGQMCIGNVCLSWIHKLSQTLCSLWSSSRRPSPSETWSLCCTIVYPPVGLCLWSTCHATFYWSLVRMWMPIVLVFNKVFASVPVSDVTLSCCNQYV